MNLDDVYRDRHYGPGYVYLAGSWSGRVIKIGTTKNIGRYSKYLQNRKYGGLGDWEILYFFWVDGGSGRIEHDARARLQQYKSMRIYEKDGGWQKGREIVRCSFSSALDALTDALGNVKKSQEWQSDDCRLYEFKRRPATPMIHGELVIEAVPPRENVTFSNVFLMRVDDLHLSVRSENCLKNDNIVYIADLVQKTEAEMLRTANFGRRSLIEIQEELSRIGLRLGMEITGWPNENVSELSKRFRTALIKVDELELSVRTANCLRSDKVIYIGDLVQRSETELLCIPNFRRKSLDEIKEVLAQMGFHLGVEIPGWPPENAEELSKHLKRPT